MMSDLSLDTISKSNSQIHSLPPHPPTVQPDTNNVTVEVSGSRFCIIPSLFKNIENLQWNRNSGCANQLRLDADPDVFEMILQYFLFSSLPNFNALSRRKATQLLDLLVPLDQVSVQKLVQYIEHYLVTNPVIPKTSSFIRKRLSSFASVSSRNMSGISSSKIQKKELRSQERSQLFVGQGKWNETTTAQKTHLSQQPPIRHVDLQEMLLSSNSLSSLPTSVLRSDSCSSDGSISKLSQTSYLGGIQGQDENLNSSSQFSLLENNFRVSPFHPSMSESTYRQTEKHPPRPISAAGLEIFEYVGTYPTTAPPSKMPFEKPPKSRPQHQESQVLGERNEQLAAHVTSDDTKKTGKIRKKIFRNVFRGTKTDRGQRKMTHADWCSSEYVL